MFAPSTGMEMLMNYALNRYYSSDDDDPISTAVKLFADLVNIHPFQRWKR